jgi:hypothetical protein
MEVILNLIDPFVAICNWVVDLLFSPKTAIPA